MTTATVPTVTPAVKAALRKLGKVRIMITNRGVLASGKGVSAAMVDTLTALGLVEVNGASRGMVDGRTVRRLIPNKSGRALIGA